MLASGSPPSAFRRRSRQSNAWSWCHGGPQLTVWKAPAPCMARDSLRLRQPCARPETARWLSATPHAGSATPCLRRDCSKMPELFCFSLTSGFGAEPVRPFARSPVRPFARSPVRPFARSPVRPFARSPVREPAFPGRRGVTMACTCNNTVLAASMDERFESEADGSAAIYWLEASTWDRRGRAATCPARTGKRRQVAPSPRVCRRDFGP